VNRALLYFVHEAARATIKSVDLYSFFLNYQRAILRYGWQYARELKQIHDKRDLRRRLRELARQRFIHARRIGKHIELRLTEQGAIASHLVRLQTRREGGSVATLIIFDIPESERHIRQQFRLLLRQAGFKKLQQSVWMRQADVYAIVRDLIAYLKAEPWVIVARTTDRIKS